jgi:hypothetical protein
MDVAENTHDSFACKTVIIIFYTDVKNYVGCHAQSPRQFCCKTVKMFFYTDVKKHVSC